MPFTPHDAIAGDYPAFVRLFGELAVPEPVPERSAFEARIAPNALFLREGAADVGYAFWQRYGTTLHLVQLVVDPAWRRRGAGHALLSHVADRARALACERWYLNVKVENLAARALYGRAGLAVTHASAALDISWSHVAAFPPEAPRSVFTPAVAEDAEIEASCGLVADKMVTLREAARVFFALRDAGGVVVGFAAFDPAFPGASPFYARDAPSARALLRAMHPHALPDHASVRFAINDDAPLVAAMRDAGARVVLEFLRMDGAL